MEPEVHIIEKYFQEVLKCFTMTNIKCKRGKEIDLLAINPKTLKKYHVEARVGTSPSFKIRTKDTYTSKGRPHKRGLDYFDKEKFRHKAVVSTIQDIFGNVDYKKILVVWEVENDSIIGYGKKNYGIYIWFVTDIIEKLDERIYKGLIRGSRDDVLRTIELITRVGEQKRIVKVKIGRKGHVEKISQDEMS